MARYVTPPNQNTCEFSLSVSDGHTTQGIGTHLMLDLIEHAKKSGLQEMIGYVLSKNSKMLHLVSDLGFQIHSQDDDPDFKTVSLPL
jgi:acetyltransferase